MTFELAVSTMQKNHDEVLEMLNRENIKCDCIVINQCDQDNFEEIQNEDRLIRILYTMERGLSKSRNMALRNAKADILAIGDDDLFYYEGFEKTVIDFYEQNEIADVVLFNIDTYEKEFPNNSFKVKFKNLGSFISMQYTFRISSVKEKRIYFNEYFGTGSKYFKSGEENIFLSDCYKHKLSICYCNNKILKRQEMLSSWFNGYNDSKFIFDRGGIFYAISPLLSCFLILRFALRKRKLLKPFSVMEAIKLMLQGRKEYIGLLNKNEKSY